MYKLDPLVREKLIGSTPLIDIQWHKLEFDKPEDWEYKDIFLTQYVDGLWR